MTHQEAIALLKRIADDSGYDNGYMQISPQERGALYLAIGILEGLEDSVPKVPVEKVAGWKTNCTGW